MPAALDRTFAALAHPARRAILARLARGESAVAELAAPLAMSGPAVTKHLKVLERAGLITRSRRAQSRPCRLRPQPLQDLAHWLDAYREFWEQSFDRLEAYLREIQSQPPIAESKEKKHARSRRQPRT